MIPAVALLVLSAAVPASLSYADPPAPAPARPARMIRLHRIDPRTVRADFERADFIVEGQSGLMRNAADDHNQLAAVPPMRGRADLYRFRKPAEVMAATLVAATE